MNPTPDTLSLAEAGCFLGVEPKIVVCLVRAKFLCEAKRYSLRFRRSTLTAFRRLSRRGLQHRREG